MRSLASRRQLRYNYSDSCQVFDNADNWLLSCTLLSIADREHPWSPPPISRSILPPSTATRSWPLTCRIGCSEGNRQSQVTREDVMKPAPRIWPSFIRHASVAAAFAVLLTVWSVSVPSQPQRNERVTPKRAKIDWLAAAADAQALSPQLSLPPTSKVFPARHAAHAAKLLQSYTVKEGALPLAHLSTLTRQLHAGVQTVPIPVLAPVDSMRFLSTRLAAGRYRGIKGSFLTEFDREHGVPAWAVRL